MSAFKNFRPIILSRLRSKLCLTAQPRPRHSSTRSDRPAQNVIQLTANREGQ